MDVPNIPDHHYDTSLDFEPGKFRGWSDDPTADQWVSVRSHEKLNPDDPLVAEAMMLEQQAIWAAEDAQAKRVITAPEHSVATTPEAVAEQANQLAQQSTDELAQTAANQPSPDAAAKTAEAGGVAEADKPAESTAAKEPPREATGAEKAFAGLRAGAGDGAKQDRMVMLGDPLVEQRMYMKLEFAGKVTYRGGVPQVAATTNQMVKFYNEAAAELAKETGRDFAAVRAVDMELKRDPNGLLGRVNSSLQNALGQTHHITVLVGGDSATREKALSELGSVVAGLKDRDLLNEKSAKQLQFEDGQLKLPQDKDGKPVGLKLEGSASLYDVVALAQAPVQERQRYTQEVDEAYKAHLTKLRVKEMNKAADAGQDGAGKEAGKEGDKPANVKVNEHALHIVEKLEASVKEPASLTERNERKQEAAEVLVYAVRRLKDPAVDEFATLPTEKRQEALVRLEAFMAKADDKEFSKDTRAALDKLPPDASDSFREKLGKLVEAEHARDPEFAARAAAVSKELVASGFITEAQAERLKSTVPTQQATAGTQAEQAGEGQSKQAGEATAAAVVREPVKLDPAAPLHERIEQMAKAGPDGVSSEQVKSVLTELQAAKEDWQKVHPHDQLNGYNHEPSKTFARVESLVDAAAAGRYGEEAAAQAKDLKPLMAEGATWTEQDTNRYYDDPTGGTTAGDRVKAIEAEKQNLGSWSAPEATASATVGAATHAETSQGGTQTTTADMAAGARVHAEHTQSAGHSVSGQERAAESSAQGAATASAEPVHPKMASTEKAVEQVSQLMSNPAGNLTTKAHEWSSRGADKLARAINNIDSEALSKMSGSTRVEMAAYADWAVKAADAGKLPLKDDIKAELTAKAAELQESHKGAAPMDRDATHNLAKAQRLEQAMDARAASASATHSAGESRTQSAGQQASSGRDMSNIAKDLVHAVYKAPELGEAYAKYSLKMGSMLTPESIKSMTPDEKAQTAVALDFLAKQVKAGALGDFNDLSAAVQRHTDNSLKAADSLYKEFGKDPSMQTALIRAETELNNRGEAGKHNEHASEQQATGGKAQQAQKAAEQDHGMSR